MSWKLSRWKGCDGGCCVRSPRFPKATPGPDLARPAFKADCIYHEKTGSGTNPDGSHWFGGCALYREINEVIAARNGTNRVRRQDLESKPNLGPVVKNLISPLNRTTRGPAIQWFLDTCWKWPAMTPTIAAFVDKAKALGIFTDDPGFSPLADSSRIYTDEEKAALDQEFHVTHAQVQAGTAVNEEPACCFYWEQV